MKINAIECKATPMVISMVEPVGGHGGNEFYDFGLCEALGKYCDIGFYTCNETHLHEKYNLNTKTYTFYKNIYGNSSIIARGLRYLSGTLKTIIHSKKRGANIAHIHIYHFAWRELMIALLCKFCCVRVVATIHDVESFSASPHRQFFSLKFMKFFPFIDRYIVHSRYAYENLRSISHGIITDCIHIVPHGDTDFLYAGELNKNDARNDLAIPTDRKIILFFGQIKKVKGLDVLLQAFAELAKQDPSYHLLIIGKPWKIDGQLVKTRISELLIEHRVTLNMSYIKNEDVPKYFVAADLAVLPYLKIYSSGVLLRALDYGTPVIVSDLSPLTDIIRDGENGRVFKSGDSENLRSVISDVMALPCQLIKFAKEGKKTIAEKYAWDVIAKETLSVYKAV
jgi:glycosyltransferase involved in cell wall biosynthesis